MELIYTNAAELMCCETPNLHEKIGVSFYGPITDYKGNVLIETEVSRVSVNACASGIPYPIAEANAQAIVLTERVIESLTTTLVELHEHRQRLMRELSRLKSGQVIVIMGDQEQQELFKQEPKP
jgi:hypothetical protein